MRHTALENLYTRLFPLTALVFFFIIYNNDRSFARTVQTENGRFTGTIRHDNNLLLSDQIQHKQKQHNQKLTCNKNNKPTQATTTTNRTKNNSGTIFNLFNYQKN